MRRSAECKCISGTGLITFLSKESLSANPAESKGGLHNNPLTRFWVPICFVSCLRLMMSLCPVLF